MKIMISAAVLTALVVLAGCASTASPSGPGSVPPDGATSGPPALQDPTASVEEPVNTVTPEPAVELVAQRWTRAEAVPGASAVLIFGTLSGGPPCATVGRVDATESTTEVTITVLVGRRAGVDCSGPRTELAYPYVTRVALRDPVGDRTVRDGA